MERDDEDEEWGDKERQGEVWFLFHFLILLMIIYSYAMCKTNDAQSQPNDERPT
jgi:hypothetical protein